MIRTTPFHERTAALNRGQRWNHWNGHLVAERYHASAKHEYFAIRNAAALFDTSPLYKYVFTGPDAEQYLRGVMARNPSRCRVGGAQYTLWCDDRGFVEEDGVLLREAPDRFFLSTADPNLAYFENLRGGQRVDIEDVTYEMGALALQGPRSRPILGSLDPAIAELPFFGQLQTKIADAAVTVSRTGFTGDLGYEIWVGATDALPVWDAIVAAGADHSLLPLGETGLIIARIEAGMLQLGVDFEPSRYAENDAHRTTPFELGLGWMLSDLGKDDRTFIGKAALRREKADGTSRWATVGVVVDWEDYDRQHTQAGLIPPKDSTPYLEDMMVYTSGKTRVGYSRSFVYSPLLQRHVAIAKIRPEMAAPGTAVSLEFTINHEYVLVEGELAKLPFLDLERKRA